MGKTPICPKCSAFAKATQTSYGVRHSCCGLHSWDGKPLVSQEVHDARKLFHATFDPIWRGRRYLRSRAYYYLSHVTGLPENECHGARQQDLDKLRRITEAARKITWKDVKAFKP